MKMILKMQASLRNPPIGALLTAECVKQRLSVTLDWTEAVTRLTVNEEVSFTTSATISRYLARLAPDFGLYGNTALERTEVDHWITISLRQLSTSQAFETVLAELDFGLQRSTYFVGGSVTLADTAIFGCLYGSGQWMSLLEAGKAPDSVTRWYRMLESRNDFRSVMKAIPESAIKQSRSSASIPNGQDVMSTEQQINSVDKTNPSAFSSRKDEGKFVELPGAEKGKVVVRFPPEASGYLHIGHAKAALLNQYYQLAFDGKLILRFDDTNPSKETAEFEQVILEDVKMLDIKPDMFTHTSDHFPLLLKYCEEMLRSGKAFCDDTEPEAMKCERERRLDSKNRNNGVEMNLRMWSEMLEASEYGQRCCVRAKIDMQSPNGCMRDPTIYRCKLEPHLRTGHQYRVYPTYDFACPIVDSVEGVTHALRTTEYHDRDDQYYWFIEQLGLRRPYVWEYSRLNMTHTVLSKRKLTWFVAEGLVDGWDDPRFPTVRGVLRRGMTVEGLKQFIVAQGSSRSVVTMEWDKIWSFNKKVIDPIAPRYTALDDDNDDGRSPVPVVVRGAVVEAVTIPKHPKNESVGTKTVWLAPRVLIDERDARDLVEGQNATFINWGNLLIEKIDRNETGNVVSVAAKTNLDDKDYKKTLKLTWLAVSPPPHVPCVCVYFDNILSKAVIDRDDDFKKYIGHVTKTEVKMIGDPELRHVRKGDIIQLQRRGFFICDSPYEPINPYTSCESPIILFYVPDGHAKVATHLVGAANVPPQAAQKATTSSGQLATKEPSMSTDPATAEQLNSKIVTQGDKVRQLKSDKASKDAVMAEVKVLMELKAQYKAAVGVDWQPPTAKTVSVASQPQSTKDKKNVAEAKGGLSTDAKNPTDDPAAVSLKGRIEAQGEKVRALKTAGSGSSADQVNREVQILLALKAEYKALTGEDATPRPAANKPGKKDGSADKSKSGSANKPKGGSAEKQKAGGAPAKKSDLTTGAAVTAATAANVTATTIATTSSGLKKQTRLGMEAAKEQNLSEWYSQVITKAEMIEYYDVSGCYILRPWAFAIWEAITAFFDGEIKKLGVRNCYFPMFVSQAALQKEKTHIADFAPEVAWVTKSGDSDLAEQIAIRPTSETVMYPSFAKWIKSHRDLPLRLNQWCNVVRWEFKHPQPFLRTREFLWQEGHSAFATRAEAEEEVFAILELYRRVYEELLAIPVIRGKKTEKEKFAGGDFTTTVEAYVSASGRGLQGATSHHLGQNFSKMFEIIFDDPETNEKMYAHQNSWGLSTRSIGAMVMVHADNSGLVLPPRVASVQVVIVPCGITVNTTDDERRALVDKCRVHETALSAAGVRCHVDSRDNYSPGWKFNHWELKGVPIRIEIGPRDMKDRQLVAVRRDTGDKQIIAEDAAVNEIVRLLQLIHQTMFNKAKRDLDDHLTVSTDWKDFASKLDRKCIIQAPFCGIVTCEDNIKKDSAKEAPDDEPSSGTALMGAKSLCVPFEQPTELKPSDRCIHPKCQHKPIAYTLFGRSY